KGLAWPLVTASRDRQRYAAVAGLEVHVRSSATHETTLTLRVPGQGAAYVSSLEFSPDGRHLAAVVDNVCTVYDMEGNLVLTVEGEKLKMSACWYDADTLLSLNEWVIYYHTLSSKELVNKWELPQGTVAEAHVSKDKKLLVSDDNAKLKLLAWEPDMKAFETLQTFDAPPGNYSGPSNLIVFSDERSVLYEPGGGGNFRYHNLETGEIITVPRGEGPEEGLPS
ncbi:Gpatch4, partial [Symbiodinium necroappetens]